MASDARNAGPTPEHAPAAANATHSPMLPQDTAPNPGLSAAQTQPAAASNQSARITKSPPNAAQPSEPGRNGAADARSTPPSAAATSPNTSTSTRADSANSTTSTNSSPATARDTTLDFAKREVSGSQAQHSFSALSSMTRRSPPQRRDEIDPGEGGEPVLQANDRERIRTPASAALRRRSTSNDQIGRHASFGGANHTGSSSSDASVERRHAAAAGGTAGGTTGAGAGAGALSNPTSAAPSETTSAESSPKDSLGFNFAPQRRRRHYEPARVVLHKSELQHPSHTDSSNNLSAASTNGHHGSSTATGARSNGTSARTSRNNSEHELDPSTMAAAVPALAHNNATPPASPDAAISGSLKQLREPRQPIYIPAVLRPTDFECYKTTAGLARLPAAASSRRPVTQHWVSDAQASNCASCERTFTWYRRKHHCRKCGSVFCATDAHETIGLDRNLNFSILGIPCRACASCADEFAKYCLEAPRLRDGPAVSQPPAQGGEQEEVEAAGGGDWSTF